ncbi:MAG: DUF898 domain-containing protein [Rubrivivax sp.]|nr:DUF898 domain-containing protein [Rubrivivax sp.]
MHEQNAHADAGLGDAGSSAASDSAAAPHEAPPAARTLDVRFVGSGSEYFRIWIVNLLLTLVTVGLYYPFAKVRKLRYFHGATEVGGHALGFHASPWVMLRGYLLVGAMVAVYSLASHFSAGAGLAAFAIVAALWPALWQSSLRFRLANTSWRGLRFRFTGRLRGAYQVMLPWGLMAAALIGVSVALAPEPGRQPGPAAVVMGLLPLVLALFTPALLWLLRRYQHDHYALGGEHTRFSTTMGSFYGVFGLAVLMFIGIVAVLGIGAAVLLPALAGGQKPSTGLGGAVVAAGVVFLLAYLIVLSLVGAFVGARLQNLTWNGTRSAHLGFASTLAVAPLARLTLKNWLLIVLTIGLYLPFAAVAMARLRLEAVAVLASTDPDALVAAASHPNESAAGDAAGDLFGFDIGL